MGKELMFEKLQKLTYLTPASPIVLVSTVNSEGIKNVAPFGMFMMASSRPAMVAVGINPKSDTYRNISQTKEFVVSFPTMEIVDRVYAAGEKYAPEVDEFKEVGLTPYSSQKIKPAKIAECIINFECTLAWSKETGNHTLFCGNVVDADMDEGIYYDGISPIELRKAISSIYHISSNAFLSGNNIIFAEK